MTEPYFDRLHPKYRCCCGLFHVESVTKSVCGLALTIYLLSILIVLIYGPQSWWFNSEIGRIVIGGILVSGFIVGIKKSKPEYLLPYLCYLGISMFLAVLEVMLCFLAYERDSGLRYWIKQEYRLKAQSELAIDEIIDSFLIWYIVNFFMNVFFFYVNYNCYKFVKDKVAAGYHQLTIPQYNVNTASVP
uniref:Uncharacterized protein n=1 Tax=Panagrolaimus sp. ES5 TaxID=591445 RepID=A0AC34EZK7_9BILA